MFSPAHLVPRIQPSNDPILKLGYTLTLILTVIDWAQTINNCRLTNEGQLIAILSVNVWQVISEEMDLHL